MGARRRDLLMVTTWRHAKKRNGVHDDDSPVKSSRHRGPSSMRSTDSFGLGMPLLYLDTIFSTEDLRRKCRY